MQFFFFTKYLSVASWTTPRQIAAIIVTARYKKQIAEITRIACGRARMEIISFFYLVATAGGQRKRKRKTNENSFSIRSRKRGSPAQERLRITRSSRKSET